VQALVTPERAHLTADQVKALVQDSPAVQLSAGAEIIDLDLNVLEDFSDDLAGGQITRDSFAELHATAQLQVARDLAWGADIVRPYMVMSDGTISARFNLGAYHVNTPKKVTGQTPPLHDVTGYDMLFRLRQKVGDAYAISAGVDYLATIEDILLSRGYTQYVIDQSRAGTVAPGSRAWVLDDNITWLTIVNDLLSSIGYQGIWADWDGRLRCQSYILPQDRDVEWFYSDDPETTMLSPGREEDRDFFEAPNRWVFYRTNLPEGSAPVEGNGLYIYQNDAVGDTSIEARRGLVIPEVVGVDAADQAALVSAALIRISADMNIPTVQNVQTFPNPLHWHFDKITLTDEVRSSVADYQCTSWALNLPPDLNDMSQTWTAISR